MTQRVIVTGAAGFIGRNVVAELNRRGPVELILVDDLGDSEKWSNLVGLDFEDLLAPEDLGPGWPAGRRETSTPSSTWARAARRPRWTPST